MEIQLKNQETGQMDTFKADERGVVTLPADRWMVDGEIHLPAGVIVQGEPRNFDGTKPTGAAGFECYVFPAGKDQADESLN